MLPLPCLVRRLTMRRIRKTSGLTAAALLALVQAGVRATAEPGNPCVQAARSAASIHDVPTDVLIALTLTETATTRDGHRQPWPWAVNDAGESHWFESRDEALAFAYQRFKAGARNFDVGCFQINFRWHSGAFASLDQMFDPASNADYAARYLRSHYERTRDWTAAAGAYHSRTEKHAQRYRAAFRANRNTLGHAVPDDPRPDAPSHVGLAALSVDQGVRTSGSLVSLGTGTAPFFEPAKSLLQ